MLITVSQCKDFYTFSQFNELTVTVPLTILSRGLGGKKLTVLMELTLTMHRDAKRREVGKQAICLRSMDAH